MDCVIILTIRGKAVRIGKENQLDRLIFMLSLGAAADFLDKKIGTAE